MEKVNLQGVRLFAPASIANISCGFDVLGLCLENIGDYMEIRRSEKAGIRITSIKGQDLPLEAENNVAGVAGLAMLKAYNAKLGFDINIEKNIKPGSGIGSSAASAAGTVAGMNYLLGNPFTPEELIPFAMEGERLACGSAHADNVAPAILGGFTLVRDTNPLDVVKLPTPLELTATVIHPKIEVKTADARAVLKKRVSLETAIKQWANVGALVASLYEEDYALLSRSLVDEIVEPARSILIPKFTQLKKACAKAGALGSGISGSGPSVFALSRGMTDANKVAQAMYDVYSKTEIPFEIHVSPVKQTGVSFLEDLS
ncbi:MAG: homoserine kinase [Flavobacteriaceae bacterium]|nr:homoserine kinase [Flavobacteriaceae bacterium]